MVHITLGDAQSELFKRYTHGAEVAIRFVGVEKVFWAAGHTHNAKATKATKHLTNGDMRREHARILINKEISLQKFQANMLASKINGGKI